MRLAAIKYIRRRVYTDRFTASRSCLSLFFSFCPLSLLFLRGVRLKTKGRKRKIYIYETRKKVNEKEKRGMEGKRRTRVPADKRAGKLVKAVYCRRELAALFSGRTVIPSRRNRLITRNSLRTRKTITGFVSGDRCRSYRSLPVFSPRIVICRESVRMIA